LAEESASGPHLKVNKWFRLANGSRIANLAGKPGCAMLSGWRISFFNGILLSAYFIPNWTIAALKIAVSPIQGLYDRANISVAMYASDYLPLTATQMIRFAWLVALGKLVVAAFFLLFLVMMIRDAMAQKGGVEETLGYALTLGAIISMLSLIAASIVHEPDALRLHATEALMFLGGLILLLVEDRTAPELRGGLTAQRG
jgi:hypothetical protein